MRTAGACGIDHLAQNQTAPALYPNSVKPPGAQACAQSGERPPAAPFWRNRPAPTRRPNFPAIPVGELDVTLEHFFEGLLRLFAQKGIAQTKNLHLNAAGLRKIAQEGRLVSDWVSYEVGDSKHHCT